MKKLLKGIFWIGILGFLFVLITNIWVVLSTSDVIYTLENVPDNEVALVLGTSKRTSAGNPNRFFVERMNTAAQLHKQNSVSKLLVSGDNGTKYYNEPRDMYKALDELDVPHDDIKLDFAGFRTLDSVVRAKEVFGNNSITIVTQEFHCYRSLFIAQHYDIDAIAVSADDGGPIGNSLALREVLARTFAVLDLYVFKREPKFS